MGGFVKGNETNSAGEWVKVRRKQLRSRFHRGRKDGGRQTAACAAHLHIKTSPHSVDPDPVEAPVRHVAARGAEDVWTPVRLQVVPDLQAPCNRHVWSGQVATETVAA